MLVKELIELLGTYPKDLEIHRWESTGPGEWDFNEPKVSNVYIDPNRSCVLVIR